MKKIIYKFLGKLIQICVTFCVTFIIAIIASDNQNKIYTFLDNNGYSDETIKKMILSGIIVAFIGVIQLLIWLVKSLLLLTIQKYFRRLSINIGFKINNRSKDNVTFKVVGGVYKEEKVEIEIVVVPAGKISMFILKILGLQLEIFFNPQIVDISLVNDREWLGQETNTKIIEKQTLYIGILNNYRLGGNSEKPFKIVEDIIIVPKRVKRDTTHIDFRIKTAVGSNLGKALCESVVKELNINCEGGK